MHCNLAQILLTDMNGVYVISTGMKKLESCMNIYTECHKASLP